MSYQYHTVVNLERNIWFSNGLLLKYLHPFIKGVNKIEENTNFHWTDFFLFIIQGNSVVKSLFINIFEGMRAVLGVAVQVMLCVGAMAFVDLDGCLRGPIEVQTAKENPKLRGEIRQVLKLNLDDDDIIATFLVNDKDFNKFIDVYFAGKQKNGRAVTFIHGSLDGPQTAHLLTIPFSKYYQYLGCEAYGVEEEAES